LLDTPPEWFEIALLAGQGTLYVTLLAAAAMYDFYRRNL
jgi:hypothetical protein